MRSEATTICFIQMTKYGKHGKLKSSLPPLPHFFENFQIKNQFKNFQHLNKNCYDYNKYFK